MSQSQYQPQKSLISCGQPEPLEALPDEDRDILMSGVMYRESVSFAGVGLFAGATTKAAVPECVELGGRSWWWRFPLPRMLRLILA